jgi:hypothetical protein
MADGWNRMLQYLVSLYLLVPVQLARASIYYTCLFQLHGKPDKNVFLLIIFFYVSNVKRIVRPRCQRNQKKYT